MLTKWLSIVSYESNDSICWSFIFRICFVVGCIVIFSSSSKLLELKMHHYYYKFFFIKNIYMLKIWLFLNNQTKLGLRPLKMANIDQTYTDIFRYFYIFQYTFWIKDEIFPSQFFLYRKNAQCREKIFILKLVIFLFLQTLQRINWIGCRKKME